MPSIAGEPATIEQVRGTLKMLHYYRLFLKSICARCVDHGLSGRDGWHGGTLTKPQAQHRLWFLVNTAINRKSGIPDQLPGRKNTDEYQWALRRDVAKVRENLNRRLRFYQFETREIRRKYSHLLANYGE